ncbi:MAG TPA: response regulator [Silvibacterium sp.]|nr:response regulator [Silvibacterium sp.]
MPSLRLLIVEDDLASLELMTEVFTSLEADVCAVSESAKAADLVNRQRFDGIFLDLEMPSPDGFQLARLIRKSSWNKSTPIVIVTGIEDRQTMQQAFSLGASFFLQKPIDRHKLNGLFRTVRGSMVENRRKYMRVPLHANLSCTVGSRTLNGLSWNVSQGGMQVEVGSLHPGETVLLSFRLPIGDVRIDAAGVVVWTKENRQGIQFTDISPKIQDALREFVAAGEK